jgi:hypothetical protein
MLVPPQLIQDLDESGFFQDFFKRSIESRVSSVLDSAILLVDKFARLVWVAGYANFIAYLPGLLMIKEFTRKALITAVVLALHPEAKRYLAAIGLAPVLQHLQIEPGLEIYRNNVLAVILAE